MGKQIDIITNRKLMKQPQKTPHFQRLVGAVIVAIIVMGLYTAYDYFVASADFNLKQTSLYTGYFTVLFFIVDWISERLKFFIYNNLKKR